MTIISGVQIFNILRYSEIDAKTVCTFFITFKGDGSEGVRFSYVKTNNTNYQQNKGVIPGKPFRGVLKRERIKA